MRHAKKSNPHGPTETPRSSSDFVQTPFTSSLNTTKPANSSLEASSEGRRHGFGTATTTRACLGRRSATARGLKTAYRTYHPNGEPAIEGAYLLGSRSGTWRFYSPEGTLLDTKSGTNLAR